ncbi:MAG: GntR family transcriptional regulator [Roseivirga sp.]|jgi:GntR family transcriptional regulator
MEFEDNKPIFLQIADLMLSMIIKKQWNIGERIPSVRDLAVELEVNPNTVMRAYTHLQELGIIYNKRGVGYFVESNGFERAKNVKKVEFLTQDLPQIFDKMNLLEMSIEEIVKMFKNRKS